MNDVSSKAWDSYAAAWGAESRDEKMALYRKCLAPEFRYTDPIATAVGWEELVEYMLEFHRQVPGGHFVTTWFLEHNKQSIAKWEMRDGEGKFVQDGVSYGVHNNEGLIVAETGFFEVPEAV